MLYENDFYNNFYETLSLIEIFKLGNSVVKSATYLHNHNSLTTDTLAETPGGQLAPVSLTISTIIATINKTRANIVKLQQDHHQQEVDNRLG